MKIVLVLLAAAFLLFASVFSTHADLINQNDVTGAGITPDAVLSSKDLESNKLLIRGGTVVNADRKFRADVYVENGIIKEVGLDLVVPLDTRVIDASGKYVMPGGIDPHVHMEMPFMGTVSADDFYTGTAAALAGGTTMIIDFAIQSPGGSLLSVYDEYRKKASKAASDYALHMGVASADEQTLKEMEVLVKERGINSFKMFMAYKNVFMLDDVGLYATFEKAKQLGALPMVHAENGEMVVQGQKRIFEQMGITGPEGHGMSRPPLVEAEATQRAIMIAEELNVPLYVVHVMSKEALEEVAIAKKRGQRVFGEPILSGLVLDESYTFDKDYDKAARYVMSPPIRSKEHQEHLLNGLASGILSLVGTDHCAFNSTQKRMGLGDFRRIPNGVASVENRMSVLYDRAVARTGKLTPSDFVRVTSTAAAQIFNIYPRKGVIQEGSDADIIILDPHKKKTITHADSHMNIDYNPFEGWEVQGVIDYTISQGRVVFDNGVLRAERGAGRFIPTPPYSPMLYDGLEQQDMLRTPKKVIRP